jgi:SAM-dependent methyltransferase
MGRIGHEMYTGSGTRDWALKRFHAGRLTEFASVIGNPGGTCLSVGCGTGVFEREYLADAFERVYAVDPARGKLEAANGGEVTALQASAPPLPFETASFDCIVAAGAVEHLPDERGFLDEVSGLLRPSGELHVTVPVEVGVGGLLRHLGRCYADPEVPVVPDGTRRYVDYSTAELLKRVPRDRHDGSHRYYNYTYLLEDIRNRFSSVRVRGWPFGSTRLPNLIYFVSATTP